MTVDRSTRFDRVLPDLFDELADARTPAYLEAAIERASSRSQRPAWTFPGRWLPMEITTKAAPTAGMPWRQLGILAVIGILIAAIAAAYVGSQQRRLADPFGLAENGMIAVARDGDIVALDPVTNATTPITTGPEIDADPVYSPDGSRIGFLREAAGGRHLLMVANADGSALAPATPEPLSDLMSWSFSPDGNELLVTSRVDGAMQVNVLTIDASQAPQILDIPLSLEPDGLEASDYRPPDGRQILVVALQPGTQTRGVYVYDLGTRDLESIALPSAPNDVFGAMWSPDGERILYSQFSQAVSGTSARTHVIDADGTNDRLINDTPGITADPPASAWSNGGDRIVLQGSPGDDGFQTSEIRSLDGTSVPLACGAGHEVRCPGDWNWSPDDTILTGTLVTDDGTVSYVVADPATGAIRDAGWTGDSGGSWQRRAGE